MKNGDINDEDIQASYVDADYSPSDGRLDGDSKWSADLSSSMNPWIQADIQYQTYVSGVLMQGDGDIGYGPDDNGDDWVTEFKVSTFLDSNSAPTFVKDSIRNDMVSHDVFI